ncbi:MAG: NAD(P)H-hydrate dehydratase [Phycisphaeraceae bacterium]|nr:NAD(P)H-hydrate dehydratase [Phycisphaeraceae bacterium]
MWRTSPPPVPLRPKDGHKGTFGVVIIIGGCPTRPGAPALAARSALRGGAGLVKIASDSTTLAIALTIEPCATGVVLTDISALDAADPDGKAVLAVGPGLGRQPDRLAWIQHFLAGDRPVVLDADGLNLLAEHGLGLPWHAPVVLTPHPGEYRRLAGTLNIPFDPTSQPDRSRAATALAKACGCVVLLKGHRSLVTDGEQGYINHTGGPALATAGSGDVLTGRIAALLARGMTGFDAACLGAHLHGLAGDLWTRQHGDAGLRAMDLADLLPDVQRTV